MSALQEGLDIGTAMLSGSMTQVDFYHLTQSDLETALVLLLKKTIAAGKTLILCPKPAATALDAALWTHEASRGFRMG